jgi:diguanylate cyclase (GGDEF)-like protein
MQSSVSHSDRQASSASSFGADNVELLLGRLGALVDSAVALVCVLDEESEAPAVLHSWGLRETIREIAAPDWGGFIAGVRCLTRPTLAPLDRNRDIDLIRGAKDRLTHAAATAVRGPDRRARAHLIVGFTAAPARPSTALWALESCAALLAVCLDAPDALDLLVASPTTDALTGCLTYERTLHELSREVNRSTRGGAPLSCCFVDLDSFKQVNDEHGHLRGNEVLAEVARILLAGVRSCDTVGRYGGDEFVAILPETGEREALALAQRLLRLITAAPIPPIELPLTASIGVAEWKPGSSPEELLADADRALMRAKALGGCVITVTESRAGATATR